MYTRYPVDDVDMQGKRIIGLAAPVNALDAATKTYVDAKAEGSNYALDTGVTANAYVVTLTPAPAAYTAGLVVTFQIGATRTNTVSAATLNVNGLGAVAITKLGNAPLVPGDLNALEVVTVVYDGTQFEMQSAGVQPTYFVNDTGVANAYVCTLNPALGAYANGNVLRFKATNANTGASTVNVNGLGVKSITKYGTQPLIGGDILAGEVVTLVYDGTQFQVQSPVVATVPGGGTGAVTLTGVLKGTGTTPIAPAVAGTDFMSPANVQNQVATFVADTGVANAYAVAPTPAVTAYVAGQMFMFTTANANTGAATLAVSGLAAKAINKAVVMPLAVGDILVNAVVVVVYDGTKFQLVKMA